MQIPPKTSCYIRYRASERWDDSFTLSSFPSVRIFLLISPLVLPPLYPFQGHEEGSQWVKLGPPCMSWLVHRRVLFEYLWVRYLVQDSEGVLGPSPTLGTSYSMFGLYWDSNQ